MRSQNDITSKLNRIRKLNNVEKDRLKNNLKLTDEQKKILELVSKIDRLKIEAFAGSGKTTTLELIANRYKDMKFLVLAFNKSVADELRKRLGNNCEVYTTHSFAFRKMRDAGLLRGKMIQNKGEFISLLKEYFGIDDYELLVLVVDSFDAFCNSDVSIEDFDEISFARIVEGNRNLRTKLIAYKIAHEENVFEKVSSMVRDIFYAMTRGELPYNHNFYLKQFVEYYDGKFNYDCVLLDEAQDVNSVQIKLIEKLGAKKVILVGDRHQSIYGWRGAVNSMEMFDYDVAYLTTSFRFKNKRIIDIANKILANWKGEKKKIKMFKGENKKDNNTKAYIFRTNLGLIQYLINYDGDFRTLKPLQEFFRDLFMMERIINFIDFGNFAYLKGVPVYLRQLAKMSGSVREFRNRLEFIDSQLASLVEFVDKSDEDMQTLYERIRSKFRRDSNVVFTTAHLSKGLEFGSVYIGDDFPSPSLLLISFIEKYVLKQLENKYKKPLMEIELNNLEFYEEILNTLQSYSTKGLIKLFVREVNKHGEYYKSVRDEVNLCYVAVTRAISEISFIGDNPVSLFTLDNPAIEKIQSDISFYKRELITILGIGG